MRAAPETPLRGGRQRSEHSYHRRGDPAEWQPFGPEEYSGRNWIAAVRL